MSISSAAPLFGLVLFGGESRRMGQPKHRLEWKGESWIERIAREVAEVSEELYLAGDGELPPGLDASKRLSDLPGTAGPAAGLAAAFAAHPDATWLAVACDQPRLDRSVLDWLRAEWNAVSKASPPVDALLPRLSNRRIDPFPGIYAPSCRDALTQLARIGGARGVTGSLQRLPELVVVVSPLVPTLLRELLEGANSPEELRQLELRSKSSGRSRE